MSFPSSRNATPISRVPGSIASIRRCCLCILHCRLPETYGISRDQPAVNRFALLARLLVTHHSQCDGLEHSEVVWVSVERFLLEVTAQDGVRGSHLRGQLALVALRS